MRAVVTVYSTPARPDCRSLKSRFRRLEVIHAQRDLTVDVVMDEARRHYAVRMAPVYEIDAWLTWGMIEDQRPSASKPCCGKWDYGLGERCVPLLAATPCLIWLGRNPSLAVFCGWPGATACRFPHRGFSG